MHNITIGSIKTIPSWRTTSLFSQQIQSNLITYHLVDHRLCSTHLNHKKARSLTLLPPSLNRRSHRCITCCSSSLRQQEQQQQDQRNPYNNNKAASGHIEILLGPMFAGKTSELLRRAERYEQQNLNVVILKSNKDNRYSTSHVVTHDGTRKPCHSVPTLHHFKTSIDPHAYSSIDVIAIDEAQFFSDLKDFCLTAADLDHKKIILAGLDGDFMRQRFGQVLDLIPVADTVTKLTAECMFCKGHAENNPGAAVSPAVFSLRIAEETDQEVVGGADKYAAVCRQHYVQYTRRNGGRDDIT